MHFHVVLDATSKPKCSVSTDWKETSIVGRSQCEGMSNAIQAIKREAEREADLGHFDRARSLLLRYRTMQSQLVSFQDLEAFRKYVLVELKCIQAVKRIRKQHPGLQSKALAQALLMQLPPLADWRLFLRAEAIESVYRADYLASYAATPEGRKFPYESTSTWMKAMFYGRGWLAARYKLVLLADLKDLFRLAKSSGNLEDALEGLERLNHHKDDGRPGWEAEMPDLSWNAEPAEPIRPRIDEYLTYTQIQKQARKELASACGKVNER